MSKTPQSGSGKNTIINKETCIGCATCVSLCPSYYEMNDAEMKAYVRQQHSEETENTLEETITACPVGAISWQNQEKEHTKDTSST